MVKKLTRDNATTDIIDTCRKLYEMRPTGQAYQANGVYRKTHRNASTMEETETYWVYVSTFQDTLEELSGGRLFPKDQSQEITDAASVKRAITASLKAVDRVMAFHGYSQEERDDANNKLIGKMVYVNANPDLNKQELVDSKDKFQEWLKF